MGVFGAVFGLRRNGSFTRSFSRGKLVGEGSYRSGQDDPSHGKDSSTSSALFDLELSHRGKGGASERLARLNPSVHDDGNSSAHGGDPSVRLPSGLLQRIIYLGRPVMEFELDLLQDLRAMRSTCCRTPDGQLDLASLVGQLQDLGYACYLKRNNPADPGHRHNVQPSCLEKLSHEFIMCAGRTDGSLSHWCLVDPRFRDQFAIAQPTPAYGRCLKAVPLEFVGTPLRLHALVETLCAEMAEAFTSSQRTLPPWRKLKSMLSKWFDPEEMPGQQQEAPPPLPPQVQLKAAAGLPVSPFEQMQVPTQALPLHTAVVGGAAAAQQSLLQLQAAAALAERQTSGGGSQNFYEALAMHQESMRLQQQQSQQQQQQRMAAAPDQQLSPASQQRQAAATAALVPRDAAAQHAAVAVYLDEAWLAASEPDSSMSLRSPERSNKPRRRANPAAHGGPSAQWGSQAAIAHKDNGDKSVHGPGRRLAGAIDLHASGSWSDLSIILETRTNSNASSPAPALLAANGLLGTSVASRRSAAAATATAAAAVPMTLQQRTMAHRPASSGGSLGAAGSQRASPSPDASSAAAHVPARQALAASSSGAHSSSGAGEQGSSLAASSGGLAAAAEQGGQGSSSSSGGSGSKKKAVSLLAKSLRSMGQKLTPSSLLHGNAGRRAGPNGLPPVQRTWSWRSGGSDGEGSRRGRQAQPLPHLQQ